MVSIHSASLCLAGFITKSFKPGQNLMEVPYNDTARRDEIGVTGDAPSIGRAAISDNMFSLGSV